MKRMRLGKTLHNTGKTLLALTILALALCGCGNTAGEGATEPASSGTDTVEAVPENNDTECADDAGETEPAANANLTEDKPQEESMLHLLIDGEEVTVAWEDNETVDALKELVQPDPLTISMSGYGGFEQAGADFKRQFSFSSYQEFFREAGYTDADYRMIGGRVPCAVAVIGKSTNPNVKAGK